MFSRVEHEESFITPGPTVFLFICTFLYQPSNGYQWLEIFKFIFCKNIAALVHRQAVRHCFFTFSVKDKPRGVLLVGRWWRDFPGAWGLRTSFVFKDVRPLEINKNDKFLHKFYILTQHSEHS